MCQLHLFLRLQQVEATHAVSRVMGLFFVGVIIVALVVMAGLATAQQQIV
jgi:hypothetical protein